MPLPIDVGVGSIHAVRLVEIDGDGRLDIASRESSGAMAFRFGDGFGGFGPQFVVPVSTPGSSAMILEDLDGDYDVDVLMSGAGPSLRACLNDGHGGFGPPVSTSVATINPNFATADYNGDGHLDVAMHTPFGTSLQIALGLGNGSFAVQSSFGSGVGAVQRIAAADFDSDGRIDLGVVGVGVGAWLSGDGTGGFSLGGPLQVPASTITHLLAVDGDVDSDVDLVAYDSGNRQITIDRNLGLGVFSGPVVVVDQITVMPSGMRCVDIDHSGQPDILAADTEISELIVQRDPFAPASSAAVRRPIVKGSSWIEVGKIDGDDRLDIMTFPFIPISSRSTLYRGDAESVLDGGENVDLGERMQALTETDFDVDGDQDVLLGTATGVHYYQNDGSGNFTPAQATTFSSLLREVASADLDLDGVPDVVATGEAGSLGSGAYTVEFWRGQAGGTFSLTSSGVTSVSAGVPVISKFDNDGLLDFVCYSNQQLVVGLSSQAWSLNVVPGATPGALTTLAVVAVDFDHDGLSDLAVGTDNNRVNLLRNQGTGTFQFAGYLALGTTKPDGLAVADLNLDAIPDLVIASSTATAALSVWAGIGVGGFSLSQQIAKTTAPAPAHVTISDLDGDGLSDVLAYGDGACSWYRGLANGTVAPAIAFAVPAAETNAVLVADFAGDARLDVLATAGSSEFGPNGVGRLGLSVTTCGGRIGRYGVSCPLSSGELPELSVSGCPEANQNLTLRISHSTGAATALLAFGTAFGDTPLPQGCSLYVDPLLPQLVPLPLGPFGILEASVTVPTAFAGLTLTVQSIVIGSIAPVLDIGATNGVEVRIDP